MAAPLPIAMNAAASLPSESSRPSTDRLKLTEIFLSLQGEARDAGWPTVFVRLTGCPLRCQYCDTAYSPSTAGNGGRSTPSWRKWPASACATSA